MPEVASNGLGVDVLGVVEIPGWLLLFPGKDCVVMVLNMIVEIANTQINADGEGKMSKIELTPKQVLILIIQGIANGKYNEAILIAQDCIDQIDAQEKTNKPSQPTKTCDCKEPMILEKSYCTQCGKDISACRLTIFLKGGNKGK